MLVVLTSLAASNASATDIGIRRTLGVGAIVGTTTGATGRVYLGGPRPSLDFAFGLTSGAGVYDAVFGHVTVNYRVALTDVGDQFAWRVGLGTFVTTRDAAEDDGAAAFGLRVPLGIDIDHAKVPLQLSVEVSPVSVSVTPTTRFGLDAGLALRYYL
ncbi:MAG: hypothetical protein AAGA48_04505 [Myxococcota bacterium]